MLGVLSPFGQGLAGPRLSPPRTVAGACVHARLRYLRSWEGHPMDQTPGANPMYAFIGSPAVAISWRRGAFKPQMSRMADSALSAFPASSFCTTAQTSFMA